MVSESIDIELAIYLTFTPMVQLYNSVASYMRDQPLWWMAALFVVNWTARTNIGAELFTN